MVRYHRNSDHTTQSCRGSRREAHPSRRVKKKKNIFIFLPRGGRVLDVLDRESTKRKGLGRLGLGQREHLWSADLLLFKRRLMLTQVTLQGSCGAAACQLAVAWFVEYGSLITPRSKLFCTTNSPIRWRAALRADRLFPPVGSACSHSTLWRTQQHEHMSVFHFSKSGTLWTKWIV